MSIHLNLNKKITALQPAESLSQKPKASCIFKKNNVAEIASFINQLFS